MNKLSVIYAGTPDFAVPALEALIQTGYHIAAVLTQPDRPAGRGMKLTPSPVKQVALQHDILVMQPETLKDAQVQQHIQSLNADVMLVAAYGLIIPSAVLNMPRLGCFNIHASLLPRWRGAAPIQRALLAGDSHTGVTIMKVVPALDAGDMIVKGNIAIGTRDTAQSLHDKLAQQGAELLLQVMQTLSQHEEIEAEAQDESLVTYAEKLQKSEAIIDWQQSATQISRQVRAFNPFPVAHSLLLGEVCRIWMATDASTRDDSSEANPSSHQPGQIVGLGDSIDVACGEGILRIETLQMPGGKRLSASDFCRGHALSVGMRFGE
ncbi:MAG: methionyl-tRNA formyltransferase [Candidatus Methylopumilus sp.]|nr:methionyl-tRNA formyltransferase [Candidatus Methylopumilus sp.]